MSFIDRAIEVFSPSTAVRRAQARMALDMVRGYDAAQVGRRTAGWRATGGSANAEIGPAMSRMRNRCRDMIRNNEYAAKALDSLVADTVGIGVVAKAPAQPIWDDWLDYADADGQLDFHGVIELLHRTRREVGEALLRFHHRDPASGLPVPLQVQVLEPDHLDESKTGPMNNGNYAITGIEFDPLGNRVAYWLFPVHPGEVANYRRYSLVSQRVSAEQVLHYYRKRRPSQVRGVAELSVSLMRLRDMADYEQAELVRKKIEACFAVFVRTDDESQRTGPTELVRGADGKGRANEKVSPGMIKYIGNAEEVTFGSPNSSGGYGEYTSSQLHAIAAGARTTYEKMTGDLSQVNYSSLRAGMIDYRGMVRQEQWLALVPMALNRVSKVFQATAVLAGKQRVAPARYVWTMPRWESQDPLKDIAAAKEEMRGGVTSLSEVIRARGDDPEKVFEELQRERADLKARGIISDADAAVSSKALPPELLASMLGAQ